MVKVFLVEDEIVMRNGIKNNIPWEKEGMEFVGEASDGELAYPLIKKTRPDILITDIRMPFMDGLELSELVKKGFPRIKIIILSGYNEFEYAKQAIHIGVTDYLLKPITAARLLEAVKKVAETVEREQEESRMLERYRLEMAENTVLERQRLFKDLVMGPVNFRDALERGSQLGIELSASFYQVLLFKVMSSGAALSYSDQLVACQELVESRMEGSGHVLVFDRASEGWAFVMTGESETEVESWTVECTRRLRETVSGFKELRYFGGIGQAVNRLGDLRRSYGTAGRAFAGRFFSEDCRILRYDQVEELLPAGGEGVDISAVDASKVSRRTVETFLKQGTAGEAAGFVEDYMASVGEKNYRSFMFRQYIVMDYYLCVRTFLKGLGIGLESLPGDLGQVEGVVGQSQEPSAVKERLARLLEEAMALRDGQAASRYSQVIEEARSFINARYAREDMSLNVVAAHVNISPSYFSSIFSQEMGITFVEYLTAVRMERARELLRCSSLKTSEIGYEVGYKDSHYFGYLFKKTAGCTPKEFRQGSKERL